jgi:hypothetical protein
VNSPRTLRAASALNKAYLSPEVAAFNRARLARNERARIFWSSVGAFLFKPAVGMAWTDADLARWGAIRAG